MAVARSAPTTGHLSSIKSSCGLSPYLLVDGKPLACHRARLRFNQARLNQSLHMRHLTASPFCDTCPDVEETPAHVLLDCPRYTVARRSCSLHLESLGLQLSLNVLLGEVASLSQSRQTEVLRLTGKFILIVQRLRSF